MWAITNEPGLPLPKYLMDFRDPIFTAELNTVWVGSSFGAARATDSNAGIPAEALVLISLSDFPSMSRHSALPRTLNANSDPGLQCRSGSIAPKHSEQRFQPQKNTYRLLPARARREAHR